MGGRLGGGKKPGGKKPGGKKPGGKKPGGKKPGGKPGGKKGGCKPGEATIRLNTNVYDKLKEAIDNAVLITTGFGTFRRICLDCGTLGAVLQAFVSANLTDCQKKKKKKNKKGKNKKGGK